MGLENIKSWIKSHYDKLITFVMLIGLFASLVYLAVRIGLMQSEHKRFVIAIETIPIQHPQVAMVSTEGIDKTEKKLQTPFQIPLDKWNSTTFVPESRVRCVDCRKPIPYEATKCPICLAVQPDEEGGGEGDSRIDKDSDGMPDEWEKECGLDPFDPSDATKDKDGDGFSNLLECQNKNNPSDVNDHPTWEKALRVDDVARDPFKLKFKGHVKMSNGELQFQLNLRGDVKTYFVKMNEDVEGFKVVKYEPKTRKKVVPGIGDVSEDASVLTLQRGEKLIKLEKNVEVEWDEFVAKIMWEVDKSTQSVRQGDDLELKWKDQKQKYMVKEIDITEQTVVLLRADGKEFTIGKTLAIGSKEETSEKN